MYKIQHTIADNIFIFMFTKFGFRMMTDPYESYSSETCLDGKIVDVDSALNNF